MSPRLILKDLVVEMRPRETVLAALNRVGISAMFSCTAGYCQGCVLRGIGPIPPEAQNGLSPDLKDCGCFLSCLCIPKEDLKVLLPHERPTA